MCGGKAAYVCVLLSPLVPGPHYVCVLLSPLVPGPHYVCVLLSPLVPGPHYVCVLLSPLVPGPGPLTPCTSSPSQAVDMGSVRALLANAHTLGQILQEAHSLLRMFWRAALPGSDSTKQQKEELGALRVKLSEQEEALRVKLSEQEEELGALRVKLSEQEGALRDAKERLRSSSLKQDTMETFIVSQLSRTRDVLKKAKTNLQVQTQDASVSSLSLLIGVS
ncbi:unnamed protein product [Boreogadus saida]